MLSAASQALCDFLQEPKAVGVNTNVNLKRSDKILYCTDSITNLAQQDISMRGYAEACRASVQVDTSSFLDPILLFSVKSP